MLSRLALGPRATLRNRLTQNQPLVSYGPGLLRGVSFTWRPHLSSASGGDGSVNVPEVPHSTTPAVATAQSPYVPKPTGFLRSGTFLPPNQAALSPVALQLERDIERDAVDPLEALKQHLENGTSTIEIVRVCLDTYRALRLVDLSRKGRLERVRSDQIGGLTLKWLWSDEHRWMKVLNEDLSLFDTLCYYLVAEGRHEYILGLLRVKQPTAGQLVPSWRGLVLRGLVRAMLHTKIDHSANPAIDTLFTVRTETRDLRRSDPELSRRGNDDHYASTSLWPAAVELVSALRCGEWNTTSLARYTDFMKLFKEIASKKGGDVRWALACLALHKPGHPDPDPALAYLREVFPDGSYSAVETVMRSSRANKTQLAFACRETSDALKGQGRHADAEWVEKLAKRLCSDSEEREIYRLKSSGMLGTKIRKLFQRSPSSTGRSMAHDRIKGLRLRKFGA